MKYFSGFILLLLTSSHLDALTIQCYPPLSPCQWSFTARGGVEPTLYSYRQRNDIKNIVSICESTVAVSSEPEVADSFTIDSFILNGDLIIQKDKEQAPQFSDQFELPWTVGGELSYSLSCNSEIFIDGNYMTAEGKSDTYTVKFPSIAGNATFSTFKPKEKITIKEKYSDLRGWGGHMGCRYHLPRNCMGWNLFIGTKVGARHWDSVCARIELDDAIRGKVNMGRVSYFPAHTVISGGFQIGIRWCLAKCIHLVLMGEAIGVGAFKFAKDIEVDRGEIVNLASAGVSPGEETQSLLKTNTKVTIPVRRSGTILTFPVHLGLQATF